jgi:hypothetical protein
VAASGWYPDPGGAPGRYRYWNGTGWSAETTGNPYDPPPVAGPGGVPATSSGRRGRGGLIIGILAALVVLVVVGVLVIRQLGDHHDNVLADPDPPESTVSGWDDSSPLPTATPTPTPSASRTPSTSAAPQGRVGCATGDPLEAAAHPNDGRVHGGSLSFAPPGAGWRDDQSYTYGMSWAYDTDGVSQTTEPGWAAMLAVGALHGEDGFHKPRQAADGMMQCIASSGYYDNFTGRKDVQSRAVTIDGHSGWALRSEIRVDKPGLSVEGDVAEVIVVDTGVTGRLSFFAGFVPIGDSGRIATMDRAIAGLQVD